MAARLAYRLHSLLRLHLSWTTAAFSLRKVTVNLAASRNSGGVTLSDFPPPRAGRLVPMQSTTTYQYRTLEYIADTFNAHSNFGVDRRYAQTKLAKKQAVGGRPPQYAPAPVTLTFDLLTLKVVSESRVTWATCVPILIFLGLSVIELFPMYATDRRQRSDIRQKHRLMPPPRGRGIISS